MTRKDAAIAKAIATARAAAALTHQPIIDMDLLKPAVKAANKALDEAFAAGATPDDFTAARQAGGKP